MISTLLGLNAIYSLGKTIQTLTRIVEGRPRKRDKEDGWDAPTLYVLCYLLTIGLTSLCRRVVCPLALVGQWSDEIKKMAEGLTVVKHQGPSRNKSMFTFLFGLQC